jgi:restriction system protein
LTIPDFQTAMRPLLEAHEEQVEWARGPLLDWLADRFELTDGDRQEPLPSGRQRRFDNRIAWATTHLFQAGLLERPRRGVTRITDRGRQVLRDHPERVDMSVLNHFDDYREFRQRSRDEDDTDQTTDTSQGPTLDATPEETIEAAFEQIEAALGDELLQRLVEASPTFFEQVVVDLLLAMGYGGSRKDAGQRLGQSGDMGIDGVIREDVLGLDAVYLQAKRWEPHRTVGRPDVQGFVGALHGARASKGVFITTAKFSREARDYADSVTPRVVLIGGARLAQLMITHGVGVTTRQRYELKRLDVDYFEGDPT